MVLLSSGSSSAANPLAALGSEGTPPSDLEAGHRCQALVSELRPMPSPSVAQLGEVARLVNPVSAHDGWDCDWPHFQRGIVLDIGVTHTRVPLQDAHR